MEKCFNRAQMNMKSLVLALLLIGAVIGVVNAAPTQPPLPTSYWGYVRIAGNGSLMPNTSITVLAAGTIIAGNTSNSDGSYLVIVPWDDPATTQVDGVVSGETITFTVSGKTVTSRVIDAQGTNNNLDLNVTPAPSLVFAVTPNSRNAQLGMPVTVFLSVINGGTATATGVRITQASPLEPVTVGYQQWNGIVFIGSPNTSVDIPAGGTANFVLTLTPTAAFSTSSVTFNVAGTNTAVAPISAVNTLTMSASVTAPADVIMMSTNLNVQTAVNTPKAFAVATTNVGTSATGVSFNVVVPTPIKGLAVQVNETYPANGTIKGPATGLTINHGDQPTFAVFLTPTQPIAFNPSNNRIMLQLIDGSGTILGAQSVAVSTT